ncbi:hypothetical protein NDU88_003012 [Pleurodeles waltl]|uniref:Uncharacterized protein n=1 Tax=Pleurodeles waltl TaxID=8319 RepID=A0AAV7W186_PLEWA|nr:hypothetical protein NDU88_003012 [Pleurodeles waltl]
MKYSFRGPGRGLFRSYLLVTGSSSTASSGAPLPLEWGLGRPFLRASSSRPFSGALTTELRGAAPLSSFADPLGLRQPRLPLVTLEGEGTSILVAPSVPELPAGNARPPTRACSGLERQTPPLPCGPGSTSASSPALIRRPRVSDPDPQGSGRSLTTPETRLKTRGGRLWWQDSGG